jgi:ribosomal protein L11 methyltransferase
MHSDEVLNELIDELAELGIKVQYRFHRTPDQNWNEEWEKKFDPVVINQKVLIRAPFHDASQDLPYTLIIEPKMSFGTGHHHTTKLMVLEMMNHDLAGKKVLDMGCGTGVLGILACKRGASRVLGVLDKEVFNIVLANITRNALVRDIGTYKAHLEENGILVVSGILAEDVQFVLNEAYRCGFNHINTREESNWISLTFVKQ